MAITKNLLFKNVRLQIFFKCYPAWNNIDSYKVDGVLIPKTLLGDQASPNQFNLPADCQLERKGDYIMLGRHGFESIGILEVLIGAISVTAEIDLNSSRS